MTQQRVRSNHAVVALANQLLSLGDAVDLGLVPVPGALHLLQAGQQGASPEDPGPADHMLSQEPKSSSNGGLLPGYTDVETHI